MRIGVVGCGNVGFSTLQVSAERGHEVLGYDLNLAVRSNIGKCFGLSAVAVDLSDLTGCEIIFICVPTDSRASGECDLSIYEAAVRGLSVVFYGKGSHSPLVVER